MGKIRPDSGSISSFLGSKRTILATACGKNETALHPRGMSDKLGRLLCLYGDDFGVKNEDIEPENALDVLKKPYEKMTTNRERKSAKKKMCS